MKRLSGLDASFLYLETPSSHMHVAGIGVFDPSTSPEPYSFERVLALTEQRLHLAPPFRQRLATVPFSLHHPLWVEDPDFDLRYHLRRAALPAPGGDRELAELAADITSRPLDRSRPLWEIHVVEGLEGGHLATISKTHHAAVDGVSGMDLTVALLDLEPDPPPVAPPERPWVPERVPSDVE
nr:wax ester/triacylglycerol synthase family O-acyltransferase [Acidimicrobiia bacterium]